MPKVDLPYNRLYGPAWRQPHWGDNMVSVWEGRLDKAGHHCPDPRCVAFSKECFTKKLHAAFCCVVIELPSGKRRYCGLRFQIDSPHGCAMHPFTQFEDNRFFQAFKDRLPYKLPSEFPHEDDPEWSMSLSSGFGSIRMPIRISMDIRGGERGFIGVDDRDKFRRLPIDLGRIPPRELRMTNDHIEEEATEDVPDAEGLSKALETVTLAEQNGTLLEHTAPHTLYNIAKTKYKDEENWAQKNAKQAMKAVLAASKPKTTKTGKTKMMPDAKEMMRKTARGGRRTTS